MFRRNTVLRDAFLDDDDELLLVRRQFMINMQLKQLLLPEEADGRKKKWRHNRLNWSQHVQQLQHEGLFKQTYRMSLKSFNKLVDLLREDITVDCAKSMNSTGGNEPIYPKLVVAAGIMAYGEHTNFLISKTVLGCSKTATFEAIKKFRAAVLNCMSWVISYDP